ncbi:MAG: serine hydrolase domain-containing protein [Ilumatobacteraceae bacterium]
MTAVQGSVAAGWEPVRDAFAANLASGDEVGCGVAVYHLGRKVVDLWGGHFDADRTQPYAEDTLQLVFSTTKGITAIAVAMCVERGLLSYDEKVSNYWPEFAQFGKGEATVMQLLSHQCGLYTVDGEITLAEALDWSAITARLAATAPRWEIGSAHGYHALTYGWLAGELVRRVDGRSVGRFVQDEIVSKVGGELWIGLPESEEPRVSPMIGSLAGDDDASMDPAVKAMMEQFMGPNSPGGQALSLNGAFSVDGAFNRRDVHAAEIPAANGITNARTLARIYAATIGDVDGVRLLKPETVERARTTVTPLGEPDACLIMPTTFGMGFMTHGMFTPYAGPGSFGHPGAGGSVAFAHPERNLALAYVMNQMATNLANDRRAQSLTDAAVACADAS